MSDVKVAATYLLAILATVTILTGVSVHNFKTDCEANGGRYDGGTTAWCRY